MPRRIRNFWLTAHIDGRRHPIAAGPQSACGGFSLTILSRDRGAIGPPLSITGRCIDGHLSLDIHDDRTLVFRKKTER